MFRHGRFTKESQEVSKYFRELARAGEVLLAETMDSVGMGRKLPKSLRRRAHIRRARAAAKARKAKEGKTE